MEECRITKKSAKRYAMRIRIYVTIHSIILHLSESVSFKIIINLSGGPSKREHMFYEPCKRSEMKVKPFLDTLVGAKRLLDSISRET